MTAPRTLPIAPHATLLGDCAFCPKMCRFACPVAEAEASDAATPAWKGALIRLEMEGRLPLAGAVAEAAYKCTDCLLQRTHCVHRHEVPEAYVAVRTRAVAEGAAPARALSWIERVRRLGNPFAEGLSERVPRIVPEGAPLLGERAPADVAYFPGCTAIARTPDAARDGLRVLSRIEGLSRARPDARAPCVAAGAGCCGYPLFAAGDLDGFRALASRLAPSLEGVGTIVSPDPGCVHAIDVLWREHAGIDLRGRAVTLVEYLARRMDLVRAAIGRPARAGVAYHDPCFLGRRRGVYDEPRALIEAATGRAPVELPTAREGAWCAGAGGVYGRVWPERARAITKRRVAELEETGAARLATACPTCVRAFRREIGEAAVSDVATLLAEAMALRP